MELEDMLNKDYIVDAGVDASTWVSIDKVPTEGEDPVVESPGFEEVKEATVKDTIVSRLSRYDDLVKAEAKAASDYDEVYEELLKSNPEIASKLKELDMKRDACNNEMEMIKKELLPMFQTAVAEDQDNKTILCNKIQATYVYPTKKHSFDLKDFMEKESAFYFDNISKFTPYAKITDVSDCVKITIKK